MTADIVDLAAAKKMQAALALEEDDPLLRFVMTIPDPWPKAQAFMEKAQVAIDAGELEEAKHHIDVALLFLARFSEVQQRRER